MWLTATVSRKKIPLSVPIPPVAPAAAPMPKSSKLISSELSGQVVTPQNGATRPSAAEKGRAQPDEPPEKQPKVAPTKTWGRSRRPKPAPMVTAVKRILSAKASGRVCPP